jgi:hypothetical protein
MTSSFFEGAFVGEDRRNAGVAMPIPAEGFVSASLLHKGSCDFLTALGIFDFKWSSVVGRRRLSNMENKIIPQEVVDALQYYVYRLVDPRNEETFYVGKGSGQRVLHHQWQALENPLPLDRLQRIREIRAAGAKEQVIIHRHGMDEATALHVEAALIDGYPALTNLRAGHGAEFGSAPLEELIARYAAPEALIPVPAMLIKIEKEWRQNMTPAELYESTRRYWVCRPESRRPPPTHAFSVARGLIREVYRIIRWEEDPSSTSEDPIKKSNNTTTARRKRSSRVRRAFVGEIDHELQTLKGCSVRHLTTRGAQNPISYVNC